MESVPSEGVGGVTQWYSLEESLDTCCRLLLNASGSSPASVAPASEVADGYGSGDRELYAAGFPRGDALDRSSEELRRDGVSALESWYSERGFDDLEVVVTDRYSFAQYRQPPGIHGRDEGPAISAGNAGCR